MPQTPAESPKKPEVRSTPAVLRFGDYELNLGSKQLWTAGVEVRIQPQPYDLLVLLATRAGQIISSEEIARRLWPGEPIGAAKRMKRCVYEVRRVLGDTSTPKRYIETRRGYGYCFVASIEIVRAGIGTSSRRPRWRARQVLVGRGREKRFLRQHFKSARERSGRLVLVTGEPGLGKTALVEAFLHQMDGEDQPVSVACCGCSQRLAGSEAYLPLLDLLDDLISHENGGEIEDLLKATAPNWHQQLIPAIGADIKVLPQERLKRELVAFLRELSRINPIVAFVDDLHWADLSTVDFLSYLSSRLASMRLLVVATYRPSEMRRARHPFLRMEPEIRTHGLCHELSLAPLSAEQVEQYVRLRFRDHIFPTEFFESIYQTTEGNPLFLTSFLQHLRKRGAIRRILGRWCIIDWSERGRESLPDSVQAIIGKVLSQPDETDARLLSAASAQGVQFDSAIVARAVEADFVEVEQRLRRLASVNALIRPLQEAKFPDGTPTLRYRFAHVLYQNTLFDSLPPTQKARITGRVARALEACYAGQSSTIASQLAWLFDRAGLLREAIEYFVLAARNTAKLSAYEQTAEIVNHGMELLKSLPPSPDSSRQEVELLNLRAVSVLATRGFSAPQLEEIFKRAREISRVPAEDPQLLILLR